MNYNEDIKGTLINNSSEYKSYINNFYDGWKNSSDSELYNQWGKPDKYPFVFIQMWGDPEPDWGSTIKEHVKVYF